MSESVAPLPPEAAEALSLYALDLLPEEERAALQTQLAADPALRRELRELQGTLDGLVESLPARPAPLHVWGRIAAAVRSAEAPVFATGHPTTERRGWTWGWQALGAAACLAAGVGLHAWWIQLSPNGTSGASPLVAQNSSGLTRTTSGIGQPAMSPASESGDHHPERTASGAVPGESTVGIATASVRDSAGFNPAVPRERALQTQVAVLTELLNRELGTPPGTSRLQIVRLVGPGETAATTAIQPETLSALALTLFNPPATQVTVQSSTKSASTSVTTTTGTGTGTGSEATGSTAASPAVVPGGATSPTSRADVAELATGSLAAATATPVVQVQPAVGELRTATVPSSTARESGPGVANSSSASTPASTVVTIEKPVVAGIPLTAAASSTASTPTGVLLMLPHESAGTAVISNPTPLAANEVYQFWQTDPATGTAINLGTAHSDATTAIFNFNLSEGKSTSAVFITREPSGGSTTPTGPVVVSTPAPKP